jgi:pimeloyl-ACP methyl ester carboxylesterase
MPISHGEGRRREKHGRNNFFLNEVKMKKVLLFLITISLSRTAFTQDIARLDTGILNHAHYKIFFPKDWKRKLVMFAHGYESMGSPSAINSPQLGQIFNLFLGKGFAVAASGYSFQGFALAQGVDDTEDLRQYFCDKYGMPDSTFMVGQSMGGGIAVAMIENFSKNYQGALAMCPLSSRPYLQIRKEFDIYAIFNVLFPNIVSPLSVVMDIHSIYKPMSWTDMGPKVNAIREAIMKDTLKASEFARHFDLKVSDIPLSLFFNEPVLRDIVQKSGGNPFDNTNTIYNGFSDDWEINKKVERLEASANPDNIFNKYDRTGNIGKPVVILHTIYDQLIPPQYGVNNFDNMVHQMGKNYFLTVKISNGQGHCAFTPGQMEKSFDGLRHWVKTGEKAKSGVIE